jgi:hypothetical protein
MAETLADRLGGVPDAEDDESPGIDRLDVAAMAALVAFCACAGLAGFMMSIGFAALTVAFLIVAFVLGVS